MVLFHRGTTFDVYLIKPEACSFYKDVRGLFHWSNPVWDSLSRASLSTAPLLSNMFAVAN